MIEKIELPHIDNGIGLIRYKTADFNAIELQVLSNIGDTSICWKLADAIEIAETILELAGMHKVLNDGMP